MADEVKISLVGENRRVKRTLSDTERAFRSHSSRIKNLYDKRIGAPLLGRMGRGFAGFTKSLAAPVTALAGGAAVLAAGKSLVNYESRLTRLAIQAGITRDEQEKLNREIMDTAFASGQSREAVLEGLYVITEQTGNLAFARDVMKDLGIASTATGAEIANMAALANQLYEKLRIGKDEIGDALNLLTIQGKSGAYTLANMAENGERLFASAGRFDMTGMRDLRAFGSILQLARMGSGSSEQATTAIEGMIADILDKQKEIGKLRIDGKRLQIYSDKDKTRLKAVDTVIKDIIVATKGREDLLGNIFGRESIRGMTTLAKLYRETGGFDLFDKLVSADAGRAGELLKDFNRYTGASDFKLKQIKNLATVFSTPLVEGFLGSMGHSLDQLIDNPEKMDEFRKKAEEIGTAFGEIGAFAWDLVAALEQMVPLLDMLVMLSKVVGWMFKPIDSLSDKEKKALDEIELRKRHSARILESEVGAPDATSVGSPLLKEHAAMFRRSYEQLTPIMNNHTDVNITIDSNGRAFADTTSDHGTARTHIRKLDRGIHPIVEFSR